MLEILLTITLTCIVGMVLNSKIVESPKLDNWITKIGEKLF